MAQGGPEGAVFYVERQLATRVPATPATPTQNSQGDYILTSKCAAGRTDPGVGTRTPGDGLWLNGQMAITVSLYPNPGGTLTGGSLLAWVWFPSMNIWNRAPDLDLTVTSGTYTGPNGYTFAPMRVSNRQGQLLLYAASALTGTSGDFLLRIDAFQSVLGMGNS